jgi:hypothetical protein
VDECKPLIYGNYNNWVGDDRLHSVGRCGLTLSNPR